VYVDPIIREGHVILAQLPARSPPA
jgi:hypothetical protein